MESNFNNDNLERFLRESSDQYRMYPSENVWKNIYRVLHTRRRWFGIGLILFLSAGFVTTIMLTNSSASDNTNHQNPERKLTPLANIDGKETAATTDVENNPLTSYRNDYLQKDKLSTAKSFELPADKLADVASLPVITPDQNLLKDEVAAETADQKAKAANTETVKENTAENSITYTPINIQFTDEITDQDTWTTNNNIVASLGHKDVLHIKTSANRPLSIESVVNTYAGRNKKLSFQFYFTPTISYRKLSENKSYLNSGSAGNGGVYSNINSVVTHKPDMGLEVGVAGRYALNKKLKLRGGIQFNTSRYDIKAFSSPAERATIALNTGGYTVDSVSTTSSYRNFNGYKSDWLHNFYFQISAPIGLELNLAGDDKVQFGIAGTLQPTYIIGDRAYLLTANYKNYAEVPWLIRRWNMNTSFEAFVSYSTGKMNWQIGPQVRYQLHSSFVKEYPVKENLFDFGLRIGVSLKK